MTLPRRAPGDSVYLLQYSNNRHAPNGPDPKPSNGGVPLHWAAARDNQIIVDMLLRKGDNPNARPTGGRSALQ